MYHHLRPPTIANLLARHATAGGVGEAPGLLPEARVGLSRHTPAQEEVAQAHSA